jgi:hypothetical protein
VDPPLSTYQQDRGRSELIHCDRCNYRSREPDDFCNLAGYILCQDCAIRDESLREVYWHADRVVRVSYFEIYSCIPWYGEIGVNHGWI